MPNFIGPVEDIKREMRMGWPYGAAEAYKRIPTLLKRIEELEAALAPFASTGSKNFKFAKDEEMVSVYMKDLVRALEFMDAQNTVRNIPQDWGIPAE